MLSRYITCCHYVLPTVYEDTQNLNKTESQTFFRYQIFPIPNPKPPKKWKSFETKTFWKRNITQNTQNLNESKSEIFLIPNFFDTESDPFSDTKFLWNQYFFLYQFSLITNPKPPKKMEKFQNREVLKPKCHTLVAQLNYTIWYGDCMLHKWYDKIWNEMVILCWPNELHHMIWWLYDKIWNEMVIMCWPNEQPIRDAFAQTIVECCILIQKTESKC